MKISKKILLACCSLLLLLMVASPAFAATTAGWVKVGTAYKWKQEDGTYYTKNGWATLGGKEYYIKKDGTMKTGWVNSKGFRYFLSQSSDLTKRGTKVAGRVTIGGKKYYFSTATATRGQQKYGLITLSGKKYYFDQDNADFPGAMLVDSWRGSYYYGSDGARLTGLQKIGEKTYYLDPNASGKKVTNKLGIKIGTSYYKISKSGYCTKVSEVAGLAGMKLEEIGMGTDKEANLKKAFDWCNKNIRYRVPPAQSSSSKVTPQTYFALYTLKDKPGYGDCISQAGVFYYMAKALGYSDMIFVQGQVPKMNGQLGPHAWCEMTIEGKTYFFDPNSQGQPNKNSKGEDIIMNGWNFLYGTPKTYVYKDSHNHVVQYNK